MENISLKELLYFIIPLLGGSIVIIYNMFVQIQNSKILILESNIDHKFDLLNAKLDKMKQDIKKEIHDEIEGKHEHLLNNIKNTKNMVMEILDKKHEEIEQTGNKFLKIIKGD